jgi:phage repressor protein C with HTH and peptisase S24 domain
MDDLAIRLKQVMAELGLKNSVELATFCDVSQGLVAQWFSGTTRLGPKPLKAFARTQFSLDWLTDGKLPKYRPVAVEATSDVEDAPAIIGTPRLLPVAGRVQAGEDGLLHIDDFPPEQPEGYVVWFTSCVEAYALRVRGESMSPRYLPGEFVGVDPCADVYPSDEVIVLLSDGRRMIKRLLWQRDDQACFESVNKDFQNIVVDLEEITALHLVLGHIPKSAFRPSV